jgi:hypothetical protein
MTEYRDTDPDAIGAEETIKRCPKHGRVAVETDRKECPLFGDAAQDEGCKRWLQDTRRKLRSREQWAGTVGGSDQRSALPDDPPERPKDVYCTTPSGVDYL